MGGVMLFTKDGENINFEIIISSLELKIIDRASAGPMNGSDL